MHRHGLPSVQPPVFVSFTNISYMLVSAMKETTSLFACAVFFLLFREGWRRGRHSLLWRFYRLPNEHQEKKNQILSEGGEPRGGRRRNSLSYFLGCYTIHICHSTFVYPPLYEEEEMQENIEGSRAETFPPEFMSHICHVLNHLLILFVSNQLEPKRMRKRNLCYIQT